MIVNANSGPRAMGRRPFLAALGAATAVSAWPMPARRSLAAPLAELVLHGPPAGPSITLAHAVASEAFAAIADTARFRVWTDPDALRAGLTSGTMSVFVTPVQVAANLYNRGLGVRLVNVMTNGLLYVISADPAVTGFEALRGKSLAAPFRSDTPNLILNSLLAHHGLVAGTDLSVETAGTPVEAIQMLILGRTDAALVPEPAASGAILRGASFGKTLHRVIDVQEAWGEAFGIDPVLPQAGLAVTDGFLEQNRAAIDPLHEALEAAAAAVVADPAAAAGVVAEALALPAPVIEASIPFAKLVAVRASEARPAIEAMLSTLADGDAEIIGGGLPDADFYL